MVNNTQTACLVILATIAVGASLDYLESVLLPFVIALFVVIGCRPILEFVEKRLHLHRFFAFVVTFSVGVALLVGFSLMIVLSANDLAANKGRYDARLKRIVEWVATHIPKSAETAIEPFSELPDPSSAQDETVSPEAKRALEVSQSVHQMLASITSFVQGQMLQFAGSLSSFLSYSVLIMIFVFFLLCGGESKSRNGPNPILQEVESQIRQYLFMKTVISAVTGFAFGLVLWLFGVPLAIVFGLLTFLLNFIPNIGPLIGTVAPIPFLVLNSEMSPTSAIVCFVLIAAIQFVSGNVIETRWMGKSFDVSPVFLLLALMFFGLVWGIIGMFLATPIVSIVKIILYQNPSSRPIAELMAGRWEVPASLHQVEAGTA